MAINLIKIFKLGPLVSFKGSPMVSPITAALCSSLPFPLLSPFAFTYSPPSINFLQLSQAPPVLLILMAIYTPLTRAPGSSPATITGWITNPSTRGVKITRQPG